MYTGQVGANLAALREQVMEMTPAKFAQKLHISTEELEVCSI